MEGARIDALVRAEYGGGRRSGARTQEAELERRPNPRSLPLRQALLENLMRASLDGAGSIVWPKLLNAVLAESLRLLSAVQQPGAIVEDTAEATLSLYELAMSVPTLAPELLEDQQWGELDRGSLEPGVSWPSGGGEAGQPAVPAGGAKESAGALTALAGRFVEPGPSGAPTRGRGDVLPTGRNFYSLDTRPVPTPAPRHLGWKAAPRLLDHPRQPHRVRPRPPALRAS